MFDEKTLRFPSRERFQRRSMGCIAEGVTTFLLVTTDNQGLLADGEIAQISALDESFLRKNPTSLAMIYEKGRSCFIMARIPETEVYTIASELPSLADSNGVKLRIMRPRAVRTYSHNLYQRLLKPDGTWDDDVSAFLSQARSKRRELSESNA